MIDIRAETASRTPQTGSAGIRSGGKVMTDAELREKIDWLIKFEDKGRGDELFTDEGAARKRLADCKEAWACHLFVQDAHVTLARAAALLAATEHYPIYGDGSVASWCCTCGESFKNGVPLWKDHICALTTADDAKALDKYVQERVGLAEDAGVMAAADAVDAVLTDPAFAYPENVAHLLRSIQNTIYSLSSGALAATAKQAGAEEARAEIERAARLDEQQTHNECDYIEGGPHAPYCRKCERIAALQPGADKERK